MLLSGAKFFSAAAMLLVTVAFFFLAAIVPASGGLVNLDSIVGGVGGSRLLAKRATITSEGKSAGIVTGSGTGQGVVARNWDNGGYIGGGFGNTPCYRGEVHSWCRQQPNPPCQRNDNRYWCQRPNGRK